MSLKERIQWDNQHLFFDPSAFGEEHLINGKPFLVVEDSDQLKKYSLDGLSQGEILLYVPVQEGLPRLEAGMSLFYDGKRATVLGVSDQMGVLEVSLMQVRG